jgi:ADP-heptose:LPS heptosyltransferase
VSNYLIFRTDRIGDFLITAILIKCIKKNDPNSHITLISSKKNFTYIKTFPYVDKVINLNNSFFGKIILFLKLIKFNFKYIIIHDDKNRSKLISFFLRSSLKINIDRSKISHIEIIKDILKKMNFKFFNSSLNIFDNIKKKKSLSKKIQLHFDEKWIFTDYIEEFTKIEPTESELLNFIKKIAQINKNNLIITSSFKLPLLLEKIKPKLINLGINLYENLSFSQLQLITSKSNLLISCHGAISHVAAAYNVKQIDIIDKTYDYNVWTDHFRNYQFLYRANFKLLSKKIINLI